jgi:DNA primase
MEDVLAQARPMVDLLWDRETEGHVFDSPERRAALDKRLRAALATIRDGSIKSHYEAAIRQFRQELFAPPPKAFVPFVKGQKGRKPDPAVLPAKASSLAQKAAEGVEDHLREALILATLVRFPDLVAEFESPLERHDFTAPGHARLQQLLLTGHGHDARDHMEPEAYDRILNHRHVVIAPTIRDGASRETAELCLSEEFAKLAARRGAEREIVEAGHDLEGLADEGTTWRLSEAAKSREKAERADQGDKTHYETAENGAQVSRTEKDRAAEVFGAVRFEKGRG